MEVAMVGESAGSPEVTRQRIAPAVQPAAKPAAGRQFYIDNLRVFLTALVIMSHLAITYGGSGSWAYEDPVEDEIASALLTLFTATNQAYYMGLFFLISGVFTPGSYDRKGPWAFLKDRLLRLAIPLIVYDFLVDPVVGVIARGQLRTAGSAYLRAVGDRLWPIEGIGFGPLWFVETLLFFAIVYVGWRLISRRRAPEVPAQPSFPSTRALVAFGVLLALVTFIVRLWLPIGWEHPFLNLQFPFFAQYISMFILGTIAYRRRWLDGLADATARRWLWVGLAGIVLLPILMVAGGAMEGGLDAFGGGLHWQAIATTLWEAMLCLGFCIGLIGLFRRRIGGGSPLARALGGDAYAAYLIHAPLIVLLGRLLEPVSLHPLLKWVLACLIALPLVFAVAHGLRRLPLVRRVL
jgi:hypothetical protein